MELQESGISFVQEVFGAVREDQLITPQEKRTVHHF
jgi:hypothetical protein